MNRSPHLRLKSFESAISTQVELSVCLTLVVKRHLSIKDLKDVPVQRLQVAAHGSCLKDELTTKGFD